MKRILIKIIKATAQKIFSLLWRICIPFELLKTKLRYKNYQISFLSKGKGEMFKFILWSSDESILLKKDNKLTEFWCWINSQFHIAKNKPSHQNFSDKADVLEKILDIKELQNLTLLISVDRTNKEYKQEYIEHSNDLSEDEYKINKNRIKKIMEIFSNNEIVSADHRNSNFIFTDNDLFLVDLESLQFKSK